MYIKQIQYLNQKMKLSVFSASLVFYLLLTIIPFGEMIQYIMWKLGIQEGEGTLFLFTNGLIPSILLFIQLIWVASKLLHTLHLIADLMYYDVKERSHLKLRILSFVYMIGILVVTILLILILFYVSHIKYTFPFGIRFILSFIEFLFPFVWLNVLFLLIYKYVIPIPIQFRETISISLITSFFIYILLRLYQEIVYGYFLTKYQTMYGNFASMISFLVWLYLTCYIFLIGMVYLFVKKKYKKT